MSDGLKIMKKIEPTNCPHCGKEILIGFQLMIPAISSVFKPEDVVKAKETVKKRLEEIKFASKEDKDEVMNYLDSEETIIDMSDIEPLLKQIAMEQINKVQESKKK